jgi:tryptophan-rich hypothetical protein
MCRNRAAVKAKGMALPKRYAHLVGSKWTSTAPLLGWRQFHVSELRHVADGYQVELVASVDRLARLTLDARALFDRAQFSAGWSTLTALQGKTPGS